MISCLYIESMGLTALDWALAPVTTGSLRNCDRSVTEDDKREEKDWGNSAIQRDKQTGNWTTLLGERLVALVLESHGHRVFKPAKIDHKCPDWETDELVVEVKTSNWTISGTAGEKVLGVPYKYASVPRLWNKPLVIVCVAYQEWELTHGNTRIFGTDIAPEQQHMLDMWKGMNIHFVQFSRLLNGDIKDLVAFIKNEHSQVGGWKKTTP